MYELYTFYNKVYYLMISYGGVGILFNRKKRIQLTVLRDEEYCSLGIDCVRVFV